MFRSFISYSKEWLVNLWQIARLRFKSSTEKDLEIIALRSQLALYTNQSNDKKRTKPNSTLAFRQIWVILSKVFSNWKEYLNIFKPSTVIGWHEKAFKFYWRKKSKRKGRPESLKR